MTEQQLTISTLRALLVDLEQKHGDLPVVLCDADTSWMFKVKPSHLSVVGSGVFSRLSFYAYYGDEKDVGMFIS